MGYTNRDRRYLVSIPAKEKREVKRLRRRAEQRELRGEHPKTAIRATRRGWWYA